MTNSLRTRCLAEMTPPCAPGVTPRTNLYAVVVVTLPDGGTGSARAVDVLHAIDSSAHVVVRQGLRGDLWHVSQLA